MSISETLARAFVLDCVGVILLVVVSVLVG